MPVALENELKRRARAKGFSEERTGKYVYGTLRKTGWTPSTQSSSPAHHSSPVAAEVKERAEKAKKKRPKPRQGGGMLAWRSRQKRGAIMKPSTFEEIEKKATAAGATNPKAVAGAAYWKTAEAKFKKRA